jgi:hypothetical protein
LAIIWLAAQFATILAAPTLQQGQVPARQLNIDVSIEEMANVDINVDADGILPSAAQTYTLDCGSMAVTAMCSGANNGAHCDANTGQLTLILQGSCSACKCVKVPDCTGKCG